MTIKRFEPGLPLRDLAHAMLEGASTTLGQAILIPEVEAAVKDWLAAVPGPAPLLIGGLAVSFRTKPRSTQDVDFLFMAEGYIPEVVNGFKRARKHSFIHNITHVEIEVLTPQFLGLPLATVVEVNRTADIFEGCSIPSAHGLIALKLFRWSRQDQADVEALNRVSPNFDPSKWHLREKELDRWTSFIP